MENVMGVRQAAYDAKEPDPYINRDVRCTYPRYEYHGMNYCWGYASAVDAGKAAEFVENECCTCEYWKEVE